MSAKSLLVVLFIAVSAVATVEAQTNLNVDNTIKAGGSFDGSSVDTVNLQNGNLLLHIPLPVDHPQRGGKIAPKHFLTLAAKTWRVNDPAPNTLWWTPAPGAPCLGTSQGPCGQGPVFLSDATFSMTRTYVATSDGSGASTEDISDPENLTTWDSAGHQLITIATNGTNATVMVASDGSGYRIELSYGSQLKAGGSATVIDRDGNRYDGKFALSTACKVSQGAPGGVEGSQTSTLTCNYAFSVRSITDPNGNVYSGTTDTLGRPALAIPSLTAAGVSGATVGPTQNGDLSGCFNSFGTPWVAFFSYPAPNGATEQIKVCFSPYPNLVTSFSQPNVVQFQDQHNTTRQPVYLTNIFLPDGTQWQISYDSYGEITSLSTPAGATIKYKWREVASPSCGGLTQVSRAVETRTLRDVNGNSFVWSYHWGTQASDGSLTNSVIDPNGNETVHTFKTISSQPPSSTYCNFFETGTRVYQGLASSNQLLKAIDTTYQVDSSNQAVLPTSIQTTIYPGGLVSLVQKFYDTGNFAGVATVGDPIQTLEYDFGSGAHGPLLRQTDTVYQWQADTAGSYKTANLLDLPASMVVCSPNNATYNPSTTTPLAPCNQKTGSFTKLEESDLAYDDPARLAASGVTTQHVSAPAAVRGNLTSSSRWLNTDGSFITKLTDWFDTGVPSKTTDPMGHASTFSYSAAFAGAYATGACDPLQHCVSSNYDFNTGLLASFTDANAPANTTKYGYDFMSRLISVTYPDGGSETINHPDAITTEVLKPVTSGLVDDRFLYSDGFGHNVRAVHVTPQCKVTVLTTYDGLGHPATVTNPYCSTSDPTYGVTTNLYDALGRVTQTTKPGGDVVTSTYNANCATNQDEAGNVRRLCDDALGRLLEVDEPNVLSPGTNATASVTISGSLASAASGTRVLAATNSPIIQASPRDFYYVDTAGHIREVTQNPNGSWAPWNNADLTGGTGAPAAISGTQMIGYRDAGGRTYVLYVTTAQHVDALYYTPSDGNWHFKDLTTSFGGILAAAGTPFASGAGGDWYYIDTTGHIRQLSVLSDGIWAGWSNYDVTGNTGAPAAISGSQLIAYQNGTGRYILYATTGQHLQTIYYVWSPGAWQTQDLTTSFGGGNVFVNANTRFTMGAGGDFYFTDTNGHVREATIQSNGTWASYTTADISGGTAAPAAITASNSLAYYDSSSRTHVFYVTSGQHVEMLEYNGTAWIKQDITSSFGGVLAAGGTQFVSPSTGDFYYLDSSGHLRQITLLSSDTWAGWTNADITGISGAPAAGGNFLAASSTSTTLLYVDSGQRLTSSSYNNTNQWWDLSLSPGIAYDAGTVSLSVGGFTATACYGASTNQACNGTFNTDTFGVAAALAQNLNSDRSPVTATLNGATINMVWKTPGANPSVDGSSTANDNPSLFPNGSFSSASTNFSGGSGPRLDSTQYVTLYTYDGLGNLLSVNQKGNTSDSTQWRQRSFQYDSLSRLMSSFNPEAGQISYTYNPDSLVIGRDRPRANQTDPSVLTHTTYGYDPDHHLTSVSYSDANSDTYTYGDSSSGPNEVDRLFGQSNSSSSQIFRYDPMGRISAQGTTIGSVSKNIRYTYNLDGSLATLTYPSGATVTYQPDSAGQILSAIDTGNGINYVTQATYNAPGEITGYINGGGGSTAGITSSFSYNPRLQPDFFQANTPAQTVFSIGYDFHLRQGDNGDVWQRVNNLDATRSQSFTYDSLNRLSTAQTAGTDCTQTTAGGQSKFWGTTYGYDPWGNLLSKNVSKCSAPPLSVAVNAANRIIGYGYDAAGNQLNTGAGSASYLYDAAGRITNAGGYSYGYDAGGNRISKSAGGTGTLYWYGLPGIVAESDLAGNLQHEYAFFGGARIARRDSSGQVSYYFSDFLHSANVITDATGNVLNDSDYLPWGEEQVFKNTFDNHFKFNGKERDAETALDNFGARFYANAMGRFMSPDWSAHADPVPYARLGNPQSLNLYSFAWSNPESFSDIDGHAPNGPVLIDCKKDPNNPKCLNRNNKPRCDGPVECAPPRDFSRLPIPFVKPWVLPPNPILSRAQCSWSVSWLGSPSLEGCTPHYPDWANAFVNWGVKHHKAMQVLSLTTPENCGTGDGESMHAPEETQQGAVGRGGLPMGNGEFKGHNGTEQDYKNINAQARADQASLNQKSNEAKENADGKGGGFALVGNVANCYSNASQ
jgi:RHS repeat-associated protein